MFDGSFLEKKAYTAAEVAEMLGIAPNTVYRMIKQGKLRKIYIGCGSRELRIPKSAIEEYLDGVGNDAHNTGS